MLRKRRKAAVAQLVERILGKDEVTGSNPVCSSFGVQSARVSKDKETQEDCASMVVKRSLCYRWVKKIIN